MIGLDISEALLSIARDLETVERLGIEYVCGDISSPEVLCDEQFDVIVANFVLSDIDHLEGALSTAQRILEPRGALLFSILHPCFPGWGDDAPSSWPPAASYYDEGWWKAQNPGFRGKVGANHRTLASYVNAFADHGLLIEHAIEPVPVEWPAPAPTVPVYLVARARLLA